MKVKIRKYVKITGFVVGGILTLLIILTIAVNYFFKDQLIQYAISQINSQVNTQISIRKVDFSLWKQFPNASVEFRNVLIQSSNKYKEVNSLKRQDTLLVAEKIFLEFNLFKLFGRHYDLERLNIQNGYVQLKVDSNSTTNFDILQKTNTPVDDGIKLELSNLIFSNTLIEYIDKRSSVKFLGKTDELLINGNFGSSQIKLKFRSKLVVHQLSVHNINYLSNKSVILASNLTVADKVYNFKESYCTISGLKFLTDCEINMNGKEDIRMVVDGKKLNFGDLLETLPESVSLNFKNYKGKGTVNLHFDLKGSMGDGSDPKIDLRFALSNCALIEKASGIKLAGMNLEGKYTNGLNKSLQSSSIIIDKFSAIFENGTLSGNVTIANFINGSFSGNLFSKTDLHQLKDFLKLDSLEQLNGFVESNIFISGKIGKISEFKISDVHDMNLSGQIKLTDVGVKAKNSDYNFQQINGLLSLNNDIFLNNLSFYVHENDFLVNGTLHNGIEYLLKQSKNISLKADITSRNLDLSKYFSKDENKNGQEYSRELLFPDNVNLDVKLTVNNFTLNKFNAKWITGYLTYKPRMFVLKSLSLETLTGHVSGNGVIIQDLYKNFIIKGQSDISRIDIQKLFYTFNNFSQNVVRDSHLRGRLSGKVNFSSEWNNRLVLNTDRLLVDGDISITNGELVNFEPMMGLSKFISLNELQNIKFSTLKNKIYVKDNQIVIPQMDIQSSAFNISGSGIHYFDNHYNYKVKVLLSEVLAGKAKKAKKENNEFGVVEDDGLGRTSIYLSIVGINTDYKISYDSRKALDVVKESFVKQKDEIKDILNREFGWYKNDSAVIKRKNSKKTSVSVDWEEPPLSGEPVKNDKNSKSKEKSSKKTTDDKVKVEWE
jgi:hypothetical protein